MDKNTLKLEEFVKNDLGKLKSFIYRCIDDTDLVEDIIGETLYKASKSIDTFEESKSSLKTWIFNISLNLLKTEMKKNRLSKQAQDHARVLAESNIEIEEQLNRIHREDPYGVYEVKEHIEFCFRCINKVLKIEKQISLLLHDVYQFSSKEVAMIMNRSISSVKHYLEDSRKEMKEIFEERCALVSKKGVCDQCSELNGYFNGAQKAAEEKLLLQKKYSGEEGLFALRLELAREIDPLKAKGRNLHNYFSYIVKRADKERNNS